MAKILISSLGTGNKQEGEYKKAKYKINTAEYETAFIAEALDKHIDFDKIVLVGTKKSIWDEAYIAFGGNDEKYHEELFNKKENAAITKEFLKKFETSLSKKFETYIIKYGIDEDELWENFEKFLEIAKLINENDAIYLDITHSFRSLSLMSFVMTQFASTISEKRFEVKAVYYGMFEYSFENKKGITPIVDIKILLDIQEWIKAIDAVKKYSDFTPLTDLIDKDGTIEKTVVKTFRNIDNTLNLANMIAMKQFVDNAGKKIKHLENSQNRIIKLLAPEIVKLVEELEHEKVSGFQFALAKWLHNNKNYALSYIALYEAIITKSCELKKYDINDHDHREEAKRRIGNDKYGKYFYTKYDDSVSQIRNSIVHQDNSRKDKVSQDIEKLKFFLEYFEGYFR